ncbi:MAG: hypothetical protein ACSHX6_10120 [Akkermansiaceae bacterium]
MKEIKGIIEFNRPLYCKGDILGEQIDIKISGHAGTISFPCIASDDLPNDVRSRRGLIGPERARRWKQGEELLYWGQLMSYPTREAILPGNVTATIYKALFECSIASESVNSEVEDIYHNLSDWLKLLEQFVIIHTTQGSRAKFSRCDGLDKIDLFDTEGGQLKYITPKQCHSINVYMPHSSTALNVDQLRDSCRVASNGNQPQLCYRMLLEAYEAMRSEDYRKAIIEAATALEICFTIRIEEEFILQGISFGDKLLGKFRMLGGRLELIRLLDIDVPGKDYVSLILTPRNEVIHKAAFPDRSIANQVIGEVEALMKHLLPQIHEN